jgi:hypothetical protein
MPYAAEISRANPTCFLFLVDQSGSMRHPFGSVQGKSKAQGVADAINRLVQNLVLKCAKLDGIRDYFYVSVIGYGKNVASAFTGPLAGRWLVPIGEIANNPLRIETRTRMLDDGAGNLVEQTIKLPVWIEAVSDGNATAGWATVISSMAMCCWCPPKGTARWLSNSLITTACGCRLWRTQDRANLATQPTNIRNGCGRAPTAWRSIGSRISSFTPRCVP